MRLTFLIGVMAQKARVCVNADVTKDFTMMQANVYVRTHASVADLKKQKLCDFRCFHGKG